MREALTFDDVQILPAYSDIESRSSNIIDLTAQFTTNYRIETPLIASPMNTVCDEWMANTMYDLGGVGVIHRFCTIAEQVTMVSEVRRHVTAIQRQYGTTRELKLSSPVVAGAVGATGDFIDRARALVEAGANVILIDVAHGHHYNVGSAIVTLQDLFANINSPNDDPIDIIAGNVATLDGAQYLESFSSCNAIRVGIGGGSQCETRIRTGVGVPQLQAIIDCSMVKTPTIADGGIRYPGDVVKSLAAGATTVMIGSLFAGTTEAPGDVLTIGEWPNVAKYKMYSGSASATSKNRNGGYAKNVEGTSRMVPLKGSVKEVVADILDGLRSGMSYVGARTLPELAQNTEFVRITNAGHREARPHGNL